MAVPQDLTTIPTPPNQKPSAQRKRCACHYAGRQFLWRQYLPKPGRFAKNLEKTNALAAVIDHSELMRFETQGVAG